MVQDEKLENENWNESAQNSYAVTYIYSSNLCEGIHPGRTWSSGQCYKTIFGENLEFSKM